MKKLLRSWLKAATIKYCPILKRHDQETQRNPHNYFKSISHYEITDLSLYI